MKKTHLDGEKRWRSTEKLAEPRENKNYLTREAYGLKILSLHHKKEVVLSFKMVHAVLKVSNRLKSYVE